MSVQKIYEDQPDGVAGYVFKTASNVASAFLPKKPVESPVIEEKVEIKKPEAVSKPKFNKSTETKIVEED